MKKYAILAALTILVLAVILGGAGYYTYSEYATANVDIVVSPKVIFDDTCIAPGDTFSKNVNVLNGGTLDYDYNISCNQTGGDTAMYDQFLLTIKNSQGLPLFGPDKPLKELQNLWINTLAAGYGEDLNFTIKFPVNLDNTYSLNSSDIEFVFNAVEHFPKPCGKVAFEHPIINNQFVLLQGSSLPIKFHLIDCKTGQYETAPRDGITLEVIGPNAQGVQMVYKFSLNDPVDTLKWDENLAEPHYIAVFSTKTYPVMAGGQYRAQVKDNGTVIGSIDFTANVESESNRSNSTILKN